MVQGMQIYSFVYSPEPLQMRYRHLKCENDNTLSQFSHSLFQGFSLILHICSGLLVDSLV